MAKSQWPVDGKPGKAWKVTSPFGWRVHPIKKTKKHHNGVDIWQGKEPTYLEAWADGKVIAVKPNDSPTSGGHSVIVQSTVMGKKVTWTYFHMVKGSIKVKVGQKIEAGTIIGKMGQTGFATGKHLHWEIWAGHIKGQPMAGFHNGKGYYDPMAFCKAVIEFERTHAEAGQETPESAPITVAPTHSVPDVATVAVPKEAKVVKPEALVVATAPVATPTPATVAAKIGNPGYPGHFLKAGSTGVEVQYLQQQLGVATTGKFAGDTHKAVVAFQKKHKLTADGIVGPKTWAKLG
jgi:murein DD-endopeptidase MepM/ murein hydrolase activator NlpD